MSVEMMAMLLVSVIQGQVVSVYNTEKQEACEHLDQVHQTPHGSSVPQSASLHEMRKALLALAGVTGGLFLLSSLVLFFGVKEQRHESVQHDTHCPDDRTRPSYLSSLKMLISHIPYQRLVLGFVFSVLAFQLSLGNFALFCSHVAGLGAHFQLLLLILLLFIPAVITVACIPSNLPVFMAVCILMGFSVATMFLLPWSMLPDVIDDFASRQASFKDLDPLFFSGCAFCSKLAGWLSAGLSTMTLQIEGYKAGACNHGDEVVTALIVLFTPVTITLLLIGMGIFHTYPVNERKGLQTEEQNEKASSSSSDQREHSELPTTSQRFHVDDPKPNKSYKCDPSPCCQRPEKQCSVKLSTSSTVSSNPYGKNSRKTSHVQLQVNNQWQKPIVHPDQHPEESKLSESFPGIAPVSLCGRSQV